MTEVDPDTKHEIETTDNENDVPKISNTWIWIILALLVLIILFFVFGGNKLLDNVDTDMTPKTSPSPSTSVRP
jgi:TM2 domain-containing membrane protein YozV